MALLATLSGCGQKGPAAGGGGGFQMPPMPVETATATRSGVSDRLTAVGTIEAGEMITVTSEISGTIRSLPFAEGTAVGRGALLAQIDDTELKARLARAEAILEQSRLNFDRSKSLSERGAVAQQTLDDSKAALSVAEADLDLVKAQLSKTRITAPFGGLVGSRKVSPGAYVGAGDPITDLAQVEEIKVIFAAPERYLGVLVKGAAVTVSAPAFPGHELTGQIDVIEPMLEASTRNARVQARVKNTDRLLRPGMSANVAVILSERPEAITIPSEAVFVEGDQAFVFTVQPDSSVARAAIQLGSRTAGAVEVTGGLEPGTAVVRSGHQKLFDGARVIPMPQAPPAAAAGGGGEAGS